MTKILTSIAVKKQINNGRASCIEIPPFRQSSSIKEATVNFIVLPTSNARIETNPLWCYCQMFTTFDVLVFEHETIFTVSQVRRHYCSHIPTKALFTMMLFQGGLENYLTGRNAPGITQSSAFRHKLQIYSNFPRPHDLSESLSSNTLA